MNGMRYVLQPSLSIVASNDRMPRFGRFAERAVRDVRLGHANFGVSAG